MARWSRQEVERALAMRSAGVQIRDIAAVLNRTSGSVQFQMERHGVKLTYAQRQDINRQNMAKLSKGLSAKRETGCDIKRATVRFELAFCAAADRNGWPVHGYRAAA